MAVEKMKYLNVYGPEKMLQHTLAAIARCELFAPEEGEAVLQALRAEQNEYEPLLTKAKGLLADLGAGTTAPDFIGREEAYTVKQVDEYLEQYAATVAERSRRQAELEGVLEVQAKTENLLAHMKDLDIDVEDLFSVRYLKVRIGRLPKNSYVRLAYYLDKGFNFTSYFNFIVYDFDGEYYWGLYFAPTDSVKEIDDIFNSLYFERIRVPEFVHGKPGEALQAIADEEHHVQDELADLKTPRAIADREALETIQNMAAWLSHMNQLHEMNKHALVFNRTFYISGFVPASDYARFEALIGGITAVQIKEADKGQKLPVEPPVRLRNPCFSRPFQMFTEMYGLPGYNEIDPTILVSIIYSVAYGIMFADLGQGVVLGLVGYFFMYKMRGMKIGLILARASVFCCIFGFLFGSVFGYEHLLDPLWRAVGLSEKPFEVMHAENITTILIVSLGFGAAVVLIAIMTSIIQKFREGRRGEAITSPNGIAGLVFYCTVLLFALYIVAFGGSFSGPALFFLPPLVVTLIVMYLQEPLAKLIDGEGWHFEKPGDILVGGFFELFVSLLEYLSNTVSFLRVGGFVLVHAGMMTVVMTLADIVGAAAPAIIVFGNIFVIVLEGLIVGIQALRLNYYEVFSRFYQPTGKPYKPLKFVSDTVEL